jgi:hypothetical protein
LTYNTFWPCSYVRDGMYILGLISSRSLAIFPSIHTNTSSSISACMNAPIIYTMATSLPSCVNHHSQEHCLCCNCWWWCLLHQCICLLLLSISTSMCFNFSTLLSFNKHKKSECLFALLLHQFSHIFWFHNSSIM